MHILYGISFGFGVLVAVLGMVTYMLVRQPYHVPLNVAFTGDLRGPPQPNEIVSTPAPTACEPGWEDAPQFRVERKTRLGDEAVGEAYLLPAINILLDVETTDEDVCMHTCSSRACRNACNRNK